jgi:hypothetical protein
VTGPKEPGDDWAFPEVDPASTQLPEPEDVVYDTGSDAWWRAQAEAQRQAAAGDPVVPPPPPTTPAPLPPLELVEPEVRLPGPGPLDQEWLPAALPEPGTPELDSPGAEPYVPPVDATDPHGFAPVEQPPVWTVPEQEPAAPEAVAPAAAADMPEGPYEQDPPARAAHEGERVSRARAAAGAAIAVAGVALGIGALFLLGDDEPQGTPALPLPVSTTATPSPSSAPTTPQLTPAETIPQPPPAETTPAAAAPVVPVSVLNNSRIQKLASRAAVRFAAGGWPVATQGNYGDGVIRTTTVYYGPGQQASAERFAEQFGIGRVAPRFPGLPTTGMTVVLTRDYRG